MRVIDYVFKIVIMSFGILFSQFIFSQENFTTGYVIKLNGDSISGYVDYRNWEINPTKIIFKDKLSNLIVNYTPSDIKEFAVLDEIYLSAKVQSEISSNNINDLSYSGEMNFEVENVFLQTLIKGSKSLYYYNNKWGKAQFYINNNGIFELLKNKKYYVQREDKLVILQNKKYIGQLMIYLSDCPSIQSDINKADYSLYTFVNLFNKYYKCNQTGIEFERKIEKIKTELGLFGGISLTSLSFYGLLYPYLVNMKFNNSTDLTTGLFIEFVLPRNQSKWSIYNELMYSSYKVSSSTINFINENNYQVYFSTIGLSYVKMNNFVRFKYPIKKLYIYANIGISNGLSLSETNYLKTNTIFYNSNTTKESKALHEIRNYEQGLIYGLGIKYKNLSFEFRLEQGNGISPYKFFDVFTDKYFVLLGYKF